MRNSTSMLCGLILFLGLWSVASEIVYTQPARGYQGRFSNRLYQPPGRYAQPYGQERRNRFAQPYRRNPIPDAVWRDPDRLRRLREYQNRLHQQDYRLPGPMPYPDLHWGRSKPRFDPTAAQAEQSSWDLLAEQKYGPAFYRFGALVQAKPDQADLRIGYGLAALGDGDHDRGAWAIYRAFRDNPEGLNQLELPEEVLPLIGQSIQHYREQLQQDPANRNAEFMLAALHHLRGDRAVAKEVTGRLMQRENPSTAAENLHRLLIE